MSRRRRLTLQEHQRLAELLYQGKQCLFEAYRLAAPGCTVKELEPLERLWRLAGAIDKVTSRLDSKLFADAATRQDPPGTKLSKVYYDVEHRLATHGPTALVKESP